MKYCKITKSQVHVHCPPKISTQKLCPRLHASITLFTEQRLWKTQPLQPHGYLNSEHFHLYFYPKFFLLSNFSFWNYYDCEHLMNRYQKIYLLNYIPVKNCILFFGRHCIYIYRGWPARLSFFLLL